MQYLGGGPLSLQSARASFLVWWGALLYLSQSDSFLGVISGGAYSLIVAAGFFRVVAESSS